MRSPIQLIVCALALGAAAIPSFAQGTVPFRVTTNLPGAAFWVDGKMYADSASFSWELGSQHTVEVRQIARYDTNLTTRWFFKNWTDDQGRLLRQNDAVQIVKADFALKSMTALFVKHHRVDIYVGSDDNQRKNLCHPEDGDMVAPPVPPNTSLEQYASWAGFIQETNCGCIVSSTYRWIVEGEPLVMQAVPYPGWVFTGFRMQTGMISPHLASMVITSPTMVRIGFEPGRRHIFRTERLLKYQTAQEFPYLGLNVVVDRVLMPTRDEGNQCSDVLGGPDNGSAPPPYGNPFLLLNGKIRPCQALGLCNGERDLLAGQRLVIGVPEVQQDKFRDYWVFDHWDPGNGAKLGQNAVIVPSSDNKVTVYTARFTKGVGAHFVVEPSHLKLSVDGSDHWRTYAFVWGVGHKHKFAALQQQTDAAGRIYEFIGWSQGGPAEQELEPTDAMVEPGVTYTARYKVQGRLRLDSVPSGVDMWVGDTTCKTPCLLHRPEGAELEIQAPEEFALSNDSKLVFQGWDDGRSTLARTAGFTTGANALTVNYRRLEKLTLISDPPAGVTFKLEPAPEPGSWFELGTKVQLTAEAQPGYKFRQFEGALAGQLNTGWLTMSAPATVVARLDKVRQLAEQSVRNAAGETPLTAVAAGSRIAIHGYNLSQESEIGPDQPLAQTLKGVTVTMGPRILPLISVSPDFIEAFLPSDLTPGAYSLTVLSPGEAPVSTKFEVVRNAPGLFRNVRNELNYALALRGGGELVDPLRGVLPGDQVEVLATGLGLTNPQPLDGFTTPMTPPAPMRDAIELIVDGQVRPVLFAGAAPGRTGFQIVRFLVDPAWGAGKNLEVRVRVNGQESNAVLLPVR